MGELGAIVKHLNDDIKSDSYASSGCAFMLLMCCYCEQEFQRQHVLEHEMNKCLKSATAVLNLNQRLKM